MRIHRNDTVVVVRGKERGKRGKVLSVDHMRGTVLVEATNLIKRHVKATAAVRQTGIVERPGQLSVANVLLICPKCGQGAGIGYRLLPQDMTGEQRSRKVRVCKSCQEQIE